ncbi:carbohydrate ABC transporter permease [Paenibacillus sp. IB182496]|uniref:Carbohydrate ABC transporter permease n=1 Tax=Paenibacillus sabuli TaxID=2772509 RepID=A0A927BT63_9BACL|nr:carbohydrate ABC transporter permease [Paenibacillus sabuli]MBD2846328.1 carbohydrate ABC transporter permease [Paenibacillus sabuli]
MRVRWSVHQTVVHACLLLFCFMCLLPMLLTISISLTDSAVIQTHGYQLFPAEFSWKAYAFIWMDPSSLLAGYRNSMLIVVIGTAGNMLVTSMVAYALARRDFRYRGAVSIYIFVTMIFSGGIVPLYILVVQYLDWKNMLIALIVPAFAAPFQIFMLRVFFQEIPPALLESAKIDGCSDFRVYWNIVLPLSKPALATVALMMTLHYWNETFHALLFIDRPTLYPIQLILKNITSYIEMVRSGGVDPGGQPIDPSTVPTDSIMYAMMVLTSLPVMFLFAFLQKYFVKGLTIGAVKG